MNEEKIYDKAFETYISPKKYKQMCDNGWAFESFNIVGRIDRKKLIIKKIKKYINQKIKVKCGYMCTSIKGIHNFYIISKHKKI